MSFNYLKDNLEDVRGNIRRACEKANRGMDDITLIGVTKTIDESIINESINMGIDHIGENKVQEIMRKFENIDDEVNWHLIGHLQTNKVKYIIDKVDLIHSVDSLKLAKEISKRASGINREMNILIQINAAQEESKFGIKTEDVHDLVAEISKLPNVNVKGLMTIAPYFEDKEKVRKYFREMKDIFEELKNNNYNNVEMKYLSMGMTNDYEIAIEEGANLLRIGTGIYGARNYNK